MTISTCPYGYDDCDRVQTQERAVTRRPQTHAYPYVLIGAIAVLVVVSLTALHLSYFSKLKFTVVKQRRDPGNY